MAALVRHDTITSPRGTGAGEPAFAKPYSSAIDRNLRVMPRAGEISRFYYPVDRTAEPEPADEVSPAPAYALHLPGRLRIHSAEFRDKQTLLEAARSELSCLRGVSSISTDFLSGGILVEYDPLVFPPAALSQELQKRGLPCFELDSRALDAAPRKCATASFVGIAVSALFGLLVERFVVAVVAALI